MKWFLKRHSYVLTVVSKNMFATPHGLANRTIAPPTIGRAPPAGLRHSSNFGCLPANCKRMKCLPRSRWRMTLQEGIHVHVCAQNAMQSQHFLIGTFSKHSRRICQLRSVTHCAAHVCSNANIHTLSQKLWAVLTGPGPCMPCSQHAAVPLWRVAALIIGLSLKLGQRPSQQIVASF